MKCKCGFEFSGPGELRNCQSFLSDKGFVNICPDCGKYYLKNGEELKIKEQ